MESGCSVDTAVRQVNASSLSVITITPRCDKAHVEPGTIILSDKWKGYNALSSHCFTHLVVNHRRGFVNPLTGVHTNTCEGMWFHAKKHIQQGHGRTRANNAALASALATFIWNKRMNITCTAACAKINYEIPQLMERIFG